MMARVLQCCVSVVWQKGFGRRFVEGKKMKPRSHDGFWFCTTELGKEYIVMSQYEQAIYLIRPKVGLNLTEPEIQIDAVLQAAIID